MENDQGQLTGTRDLGDALALVTKEHATLVLTEAHKHQSQLTAYFSSMVERYRDALLEDDESKSPAQVILVSHNDEVPPELRRMCQRLDLPLPSPDEICTVLVRLARSAQAIEPAAEDLTKLCRAAAGMSESELTTAALDCLRRLGGLDERYLNRSGWPCGSTASWWENGPPPSGSAFTGRTCGAPGLSSPSSPSLPAGRPISPGRI